MQEAAAKSWLVLSLRKVQPNEIAPRKRKSFGKLNRASCLSLFSVFRSKHGFYLHTFSWKYGEEAREEVNFV